MLVKNRITLSKAILIMALGLDLLTRLSVLAHSLSFLDGLVIHDDAYLSLTIARNIARTLAPLYGTEPTNGFQPLYVFLVAPFYILFSHDAFIPVYMSLGLLIIFDLLALYFLLKIVGNMSQSPLTLLFAAMAWVFNGYILRTTLNGLETMVAFCFLVMAVHYFYKLRAAGSTRLSWRSGLGVGAILGLAVLARIDGLFLVAAMVIVLLLEGLRRQRHAVYLNQCFWLIFGVFLVNLPWLFYSWHFTGEFYPISGRAVRFISISNANHSPNFGNTFWPSIRTALFHVKANNAVWLGLGAIFILMAPLCRRPPRPKELFRRLAQHDVVFLFSVMLTLVYVFYILASWYYFRYLFPLVLPLLLFLVTMFDFYLNFFAGRSARRIFAMLAIAAICLPQLVYPPGGAFPRFIDLYFSPGGGGYMPLGLWARDKFKDGTAIGAPQSGALGYFADNLRVYNLDGVVSTLCYESLRSHQCMTYIRRRGIQYVIGWPLNIQMIQRESKDYRQGDLIPTEKINGIQSWGHEWYVWRVSYDRRT